MTDRFSTEFHRRTIGGYILALSSGSPTPGGGSAAGLAGALGCSLGAMVCNLTLVKQQNEAVASLAERFSAMADRFIDLAANDELAFASYRLATALPRSTDEEKASRRAAIEAALIEAAEVPLQMVAAGTMAIDCLRRAAELGTPHALGDLMTGGFLLQAMSLGSLENIAANTSSMSVAANRERFEGAVLAAQVELGAGMSALQQAIVVRRG